MSTFRVTRSGRVFLQAWAACGLLFASSGAVAQKVARRQAPPDKNVLAKGNLYYSSDDITDKAAREYRQVKKKYRGTKDAEAAQYLLASYYHRKFYIIRTKQREDDEDAIHEAQEEYEDYIKTYATAPSPEWLADSYFNLALIWFEYGHKAVAVNHLNKLQQAAEKDPKVYIYDVLWSPRSNDRVEGHYNSAQLAAFTREQINNGLTTGQIVEVLREWCRGQRRR